MFKKILTISLLLVLANAVNAQTEEYVQEGEFGITIGSAFYFGDINTTASFSRPKPAIGIFYRRQFGNYVAVRLSAHYAELGYSDIYSKNEFQLDRNLSFNTNIWEIALLGDFNFFKFLPQDPNYRFTPYVSLGIGVFSYDPYAYLDGTKNFLRPLGTEGQNFGYMGRTPYNTMAFCIPVGVGIKYNITDKINLSFEAGYRFAFTDYIDDVSTTYAGINNFPTTGNGPTARLLQDRSYEIHPGVPLGVEGRQRGWSKQKDQYLFLEVGVSFNISTYKCPTAN